ncbi:MAG: YraN family protein [Saprospiraceae bacterium]|jgi:putative endonuclease|nr:YraN family protein [Saprospiraceae bacterium]
MADHNNIGKKGEEIAKKYLEAHGYKILETNWRFSRAEVDLIAMDKEIMVFVEVKTRSYDSFGKPEEFVSRAKEKMLMDAASVYTNQVNHDWEIRFDIISIISKGDCHELKHFKDAFFDGWG